MQACQCGRLLAAACQCKHNANCNLLAVSKVRVEVHTKYYLRLLHSKCNPPDGHLLMQVPLLRLEIVSFHQKEAASKKLPASSFARSRLHGPLKPRSSVKQGRLTIWPLYRTGQTMHRMSLWDANLVCFDNFPPRTKHKAQSTTETEQLTFLSSPCKRMSIVLRVSQPQWPPPQARQRCVQQAADRGRHDKHGGGATMRASDVAPRGHLFETKRVPIAPAGPE
ncbi:hypothetical protein J3F83DRAFT_732818 [Trichoderma novae-zelandiae]